MKNLYIYCEGQTEESFINEILYEYLIGIGINARPIVCTTKRTKTAKFRGGVSDYRKISSELTILCKQHKNEAVTTMFDYYGLPNNTPEIDNTSGGLYDRVERIERAVEADIGASNLFFNLIVHEFEGLLFTDTSVFETVANSGIVTELQEMRESFESPEHINNSVITAPSKRIERLIPDYAKVINGTVLSRLVGIDAMLAECRHFREWVARMRGLVG